MRDPTGRFSDRVEPYARYRPGYPRECLDLLRAHGWLLAGDAVADVGSGTGRLAELFLDAGHTVTGVEPNREMREAGERELSGRLGFRSVDGRAEATTLAADSVDLIVAGQAFHWFDAAAARREFARILRPGGRVALVWNDRDTAASPLMASYEALVREHGTDYDEVKRHWIDEREIGAFFEPADFEALSAPHRQVLDLAGFEGRLVSSSYVPAEGTPGHRRILARLRELFDEHQRSGRVALEYRTKMYCGFLEAP